MASRRFRCYKTSRPREAKESPGGNRFEIASVEGSVGGHHDHPGAAARSPRMATWVRSLPSPPRRIRIEFVTSKLFTHGPGDREHAAEVRRPAHRAGSSRIIGRIRDECRSLLPAGQAVPVPRRRSPRRPVRLWRNQLLPDALAVDVLAPDVVESAVIGLTDQGVDRPYRFVAFQTQGVGDNRLHGLANRQRVRQDDGVSNVPNSSTWVEPASLPKALPTNTAPATFSWTNCPHG